MTTIDVTPAAAVEIRKRIDALALPHGCAVIVRPTRQADLQRGPGGEAVWTVEQASSDWVCGVLPLPMHVPEFEPRPIRDIGGIPFTVCGSLDDDAAFRITLVDGGLHVEVSST